MALKFKLVLRSTGLTIYFLDYLCSGLFVHVLSPKNCGARPN